MLFCTLSVKTDANTPGSVSFIGFKRAIDFLRSISYITETASYSTIAYRFHKSRSGRCYFLISLFCFLLDGVFRLLYYLLWMGHCILHPFSSRFYSTDDCFYSFLCCTLNPAPQGMSCRITVIQRIIGRIIIAVSGQWIYYYFNNTLEDIYKQWVQHRAETQIVSQKTIEEDIGIWNRFIADTELARMQIAEIKPVHIMKLFQIWTGNGKITRKDFNNRKSVLNGVFRHAVLNEIITFSPITDLPCNTLKFKLPNASKKLTQ